MSSKNLIMIARSNTGSAPTNDIQGFDRIPTFLWDPNNSDKSFDGCKVKFTSTHAINKSSEYNKISRFNSFDDEPPFSIYSAGSYSVNFNIDYDINNCLTLVIPIIPVSFITLGSITVEFMGATSSQPLTSIGSNLMYLVLRLGIGGVSTPSSTSYKVVYDSNNNISKVKLNNLIGDKSKSRYLKITYTLGLSINPTYYAGKPILIDSEIWSPIDPVWDNGYPYQCEVLATSDGNSRSVSRVSNISKYGRESYIITQGTNNIDVYSDLEVTRDGMTSLGFPKLLDDDNRLLPTYQVNGDINNDILAKPYSEYIINEDNDLVELNQFFNYKDSSIKAIKSGLMPINKLRVSLESPGTYYIYKKPAGNVVYSQAGVEHEIIPAWMDAKSLIIALQGAGGSGGVESWGGWNPGKGAASGALSVVYVRLLDVNLQYLTYELSIGSGGAARNPGYDDYADGYKGGSTKLTLSRTSNYVESTGGEGGLFGYGSSTPRGGQVNSNLNSLYMKLIGSYNGVDGKDNSSSGNSSPSKYPSTPPSCYGNLSFGGYSGGSSVKKANNYITGGSASYFSNGGASSGDGGTAGNGSKGSGGGSSRGRLDGTVLLYWWGTGGTSGRGGDGLAQIFY